MTSSTQELEARAGSEERRVRELALDALYVMSFSVGASVSLVCGLVALMSLVH